MNSKIESARRQLLESLDSAKPQSVRNRLGQFATPFMLANEIITRAASLLPVETEIRFLEPGFGTGTFYSALTNSPLITRVTMAHGIEVDPHYGEAAERLWKETGLRLIVDDFTMIEPPQDEESKFNLVVCNPPYVRHHHLNQRQKKELQSTVVKHIGFELNGLSGLYAYFMILSQAWMSKDGVGAWLIPSEFMDVNYGRKVKQFLLENVELKEIYRFNPNELQFKDALVSSAIVFFVNSRPSRTSKVKITFGGTLGKPKQTQEVNVEQLESYPKWSVLFQDSPRNSLRNSSNVTLGDFFTIKRGLATGCNSFFIVTPDQIEENHIPSKFLIPILPSPKDLETNEISADNNGMPKVKKQLFLLSCNLPEKEVLIRYPLLWRYFEQGVNECINRGYLCQHRSPWYSQEIRPPAPIMCSYMGRPTKRSDVPFRFILNHSKATAANAYLLMYPNQALDSVINNNYSVLREIWKALSSITAETLIREGRIYGGGLHKMEPKELRNVPADVVQKAILNASKGRLISE